MTGPVPLVLLPGLLCDARLFAPQIAALSGARAVMVSPITAHDTVAALAGAVLAAAPARFALAGLSMGGIVAMAVARQAPGRLAGLALLDTNPFAESPAVQARRGPQVARAEADLAAVLRDELLPHYLATDPAPGHDAIRQTCLAMALALGPAVFARQSRALAARPDQTDTLRAWRGPALVLTGADDRLCPRDRHDAMAAAMPQARYAVIDGAGHLPTLEQPEAVTEALRRWLDAC